MSCEKIKYKDDFRAPILGKYKCKVEVYKQENCLPKNLIFTKEITLTVHTSEDSLIEISPAYYYNSKTVQSKSDKLRFISKQSCDGVDTCLIFDNGSLGGYTSSRFCVLRIDKDTFVLNIATGCSYDYSIRGKR